MGLPLLFGTTPFHYLNPLRPERRNVPTTKPIGGIEAQGAVGETKQYVSIQGSQVLLSKATQ